MRQGGLGSYEVWLRAIIRTREANGSKALAHSAVTAGGVARTRWALGPFFVSAVFEAECAKQGRVRAAEQL